MFFLDEYKFSIQILVCERWFSIQCFHFFFCHNRVVKRKYKGDDFSFSIVNYICLFDAAPVLKENMDLSGP